MAEDAVKKVDEAKVLIVSSSPHLTDAGDSRRVMYEVAIGTFPALVMSLYLFGGGAAAVVIASIVGCLGTEYVFNAVRKRPQTWLDGSALVTGLILGLSLPAALHWWMALVGGIVAIGVGKMVFGGLGSNIFNPAMVGRAFLMACFGTLMTTWVAPSTLTKPAEAIAADADGPAVVAVAEDVDATSHPSPDVDAMSGPTPLALAKQVLTDAHNDDVAAENKAQTAWVNDQWRSMFWGTVRGSVGETSALLWLIGGVWLLLRRTITWHIPVSVLGSAGLIALGAWLAKPDLYANPLVHLTGGGLMMCAFFIATDPVSCPLSRSGRMIFGAGVGVLVMLIRLVGGYPEGVMYAILLMNSLTPLLDRWTRPTPLGGHAMQT